MSEPIDLLDVAAKRLHEAREGLHRTLWMQNSPEAEMHMQRALLNIRIAEKDLDAVQAMAVDLDASPCDLR